MTGIKRKDEMKIEKMGTDIPPVGLGCWAIGGVWTDMGAQAGWGDVDDAVSLRALQTGLDMGVKLIDTANIYGAGHSEKLVGKALRGRREKALVVTKFGILCDEERKCTTGIVQSKEDIVGSCEDSLRRLQTDYIDVFLFHCGDYEKEKAPMVLDTLEELVRAGKIRYYGWSTSDPERAKIIAGGAHAAMMEFAENVMEDDPVMTAFCERHKLAGLCRSPLAMGILTGKYRAGMQMPENDLRGIHAAPWMEYFIDGKPNQVFLDKLEAIREILTSGGRTLAQGCISWILGRGERMIPIPGFKSEKQVEENVSALDFGALSKEQMEEIDRILKRTV